jgi:hypothetical protein
MRSSAWLRGTFSEQYAELHRRFGEEAADVRHELLYLAAGRTPLKAGLRALGALLRDIRLLLQNNGPRLKPLEGRQAVLLTTLAGTSGWGALQRTIPLLEAAGYEPVILAHPRLPEQVFPPERPVFRPARVDSWAWCAALHVFLTTLCQRKPLLIACCLTRRRLWAGSLRATLKGSRGVILLHNDFDLMSRAAIGQGVSTLCVQHGVPTDEFFPTRADWYLVWGDNSRAAFDAQPDSLTQLVEDGLGRGSKPDIALTPPQGISLLSQTHAHVLGDDIHQALNDFAKALLDHAPSARILLHPLEVTPYTGAAALATRRAPHPELQAKTEASCLVVGYCSTAMLDAALAGHWVVALQLPLQGNLAARSILAAPLRAKTAQQVVELYQRLHEDAAFRHEIAEAQAQWLRSSFSTEPGGLASLLHRIEQQSSTECRQ